ncbi:MAG: endonuclease/exonuclease/phosphatase family protein [Rhodocyclaceae bacterium]|nr:endonuclease/exonuclease/phosphatase family protein [Rhodocyclaceae bacterium]
MKDHTLHVATYNIHKGFSQFNRRMVVHELRERLRSLGPDIVFLQEVQGLHLGHAEKHDDWPDQPQHEFLAEDTWRDTAYGGNALYDHGHHGNAILSAFPILVSANQDISDHRLEKRGLLHCELGVPGLASPLHCVCVHLGLLGRSRKRQMEALALRMEQLVPPEAPLIIAGDFNDWRNRADDLLCERLGLVEVFGGAVGRPARSFPSTLPLFRLDRIYVRGMAVRSAQVHFGPPWSEISDHAALSARLALTP